MLRMMGVITVFLAATGVACADLAPERRSPPAVASAQLVRDYGHACPDPAKLRRLASDPADPDAQLTRVVCGDGKAFKLSIKNGRRRNRVSVTPMD